MLVSEDEKKPAQTMMTARARNRLPSEISFKTQNLYEYDPSSIAAGRWPCQERLPVAEGNAQSQRGLLVVVIDQAFTVAGGELHVKFGGLGQRNRGGPVNL